MKCGYLKDQFMFESVKLSGKIGLYIATHDQMITFSEQEKSNRDILIPIQVGASLSEAKLYDTRDDYGDNISDKNGNFCELTALYWIWKNDTHSIKGLSHYRRRFLINANEILEKMSEYDVIIPTPYYFRTSLREEYKNYHILDDLERTIHIVISKNPEMEPALIHVLEENLLIPYNMWITSECIWNDYCEWLFSILFQLEKEINLTGRNKYQRRVFGFLSERLFTAYIYQNNLKCFICPTDIPENSTFIRKMKYKCGIHVNRFLFKWRKSYGTD